MAVKRRIEVFSAGCAPCEETVAMVKRLACQSCEVEVLDMHDPAIAARAKNYGVRAVPAIVIDGNLASCCASAGPNEITLRAAGAGTPLP
jgi:glutaredoxin 3